MKISEVLWKAANEHLWDGDSAANRAMYSCRAVSEAEGVHWTISRRAIPFLETLGLDPSSNDAFGEFRDVRDRQGARYAWLMFASMYAEEQGL